VHNINIVNESNVNMWIYYQYFLLEESDRTSTDADSNFLLGVNPAFLCRGSSRVVVLVLVFSQ